MIFLHTSLMQIGNQYIAQDSPTISHVSNPFCIQYLLHTKHMTAWQQVWIPPAINCHTCHKQPELDHTVAWANREAGLFMDEIPQTVGDPAFLCAQRKVCL